MNMKQLYSSSGGIIRCCIWQEDIRKQKRIEDIRPDNRRVLQVG